MSDVTATIEQEARPCPQCCYDLRGLTVLGRCPECGGDVSRLALAGGQLPWVSSQVDGRWRAFWRTVGLLALRRPLALGSEMTRAVDDAAARAFLAVAGALGAAALGLAGAGVAWRAYLPAEFTQPVAGGGLPIPRADLHVPLALAFHPVSAGLACVILGWLFPRSVVTAFAWLWNDGQQPAARRGVSLSRYLSAMTLGLFVGLCLALNADVVDAMRRALAARDHLVWAVAEQVTRTVGAAVAGWCGMWAVVALTALLRRAGATSGQLAVVALTLGVQTLALAVVAALLAIWLPGYFILIWRALA